MLDTSGKCFDGTHARGDPRFDNDPRHAEDSTGLLVLGEHKSPRGMQFAGTRETVLAHPGQHDGDSGGSRRSCYGVEQHRRRGSEPCDRWRVGQDGPELCGDLEMHTVRREVNGSGLEHFVAGCLFHGEGHLSPKPVDQAGKETGNEVLDDDDRNWQGRW